MSGVLRSLYIQTKYKQLIKVGFLPALLLMAGLSACSTGPKVTGKPDMPVNISPASGASINKGTEVEFVWQQPASATHFDFHVFNRADGVMVTDRRKLAVQDVCVQGRCSIRETIDVPVHPRHSWRVRSTNYLGVTSYSRSYFDTVNTSVGTVRLAGSSGKKPAAPAVISPAYATSVQRDTNVQFSWEAVPQALVYDFHIYNSVDGAYVKLHTDVPASTICRNDKCTLPVMMDIPASDRHFWKLRAGNRFGKSSWINMRVGVAQ